MSNKVGWYIDIHIRKDDVNKVKKMLKQHNINYKITIEDIEQLITEGKSPKQAAPYWSVYPYLDYDDYNSYADIARWMRYLSEKYKESVKLELQHFKTYKGRWIYGLNFHEPNAIYRKPVVVLHGAMQARDWITPAVLMYMSKWILDPPTSEMRSKITQILKTYDIEIWPVINPDGYVYTHTTDRLWNKNIAPQAFGCKGVNLDRNFEVYWGENGLDKIDPCSNDFPGQRAYSEKETGGIKTYHIHRARAGVYSYWNLHAYGQSILYPYGYRTKSTWYDGTLNRVATAFANGATQRYGTKFQASQASKVEGIAGGQAIDYMYDKGGVTYAYSVHLRPGAGADNDNAAFMLPTSEIKPSAEEFMDGFLEAVLQMMKE